MQDVKNRVLVVDTNYQPMTPVHPAVARKLIKHRKAAIFRRQPFTIVMRSESTEKPKEHTLKIDPGSKQTGLAVVDTTTNTVVWTATLVHRGQAIKARLLSRSQIRRARRSRKCRYRKPRFDNRAKPKGWLAPSLMSRVHNTMTWVNRLRKFCNITELSVERVKFDMALMKDPAIKGKGYQQGDLYRTNLWEYLLERDHRTCQYCGAKNTRLERDHIQPKSKGGLDNKENLVLACKPCNQAKSNIDVRVFLKNRPLTLKKVLNRKSARLSDAAAVNATRNKLLRELIATGLPVETGTGAQTKLNRVSQGYPKEHWIDAACVGDSGRDVHLNSSMAPLVIKAMGYGNRQVTRTDKYGFPNSKPKSTKRLLSPVGYIKTGDIVQLDVTTGKYQGMSRDRISSIHTTSNFLSILVDGRKRAFSVRHVTHLLHLHDGYSYNNRNQLC